MKKATFICLLLFGLVIGSITSESVGLINQITSTPTQKIESGCPLCGNFGFVSCSNCAGRGYILHGGMYIRCSRCNGKMLVRCPNMAYHNPDKLFVSKE